MTEPAKKKRQMLSREVWLDAAYDSLVHEGIDGVRVLKLANKLGVTRGSFYWRFESQADLLSEMLAIWKIRNTNALIEAANARPADLDEWYVGLMKCWLDATQFDPRLDIAVRDWSRRDKSIYRMVQEEDTIRIRSMTKAFIDLGGDKERMAFTRARVLYYKQMGYYLIGAQEPLDFRLGYLAEYCEIITGRPMNPLRIKEFMDDLKPHMSQIDHFANEVTD